MDRRHFRGNLGPLAAGTVAYRATVTMVALVCVAGCRPTEERPPIVWAGDNLRFGTDEPIDGLCGGTLTRADEFTGYIGSMFGNTGAQVDYFWNPDEVHPRCGPIPGCTIGSEAQRCKRRRPESGVTPSDAA